MVALRIGRGKRCRIEEGNKNLGLRNREEKRRRRRLGVISFDRPYPTVLHARRGNVFGVLVGLGEA